MLPIIKSRPRFFVRPCGGLGNKIRSLISTMAVAHRKKMILSINWPDFNNLFELNYPYELLTEKEFGSGGNQEVDNKASTCYMIGSDLSFIDRLKPILELREKIKNFQEKYMKDIEIGLHIRSHHPEVKHAFYNKWFYSVKKSIRPYLPFTKGKRFFVCSDDKRIDDWFKKYYKDQVVIYQKRNKRKNRWDDLVIGDEKRTSLIELQDAVIDLYLLASMPKIILSGWSSFSSIAQLISGHNNYTVLKAEEL